MNMFTIHSNCLPMPTQAREHVIIRRTYQGRDYLQGASRVASMQPKNPLHELLHQQVGIDTFALDGDDTLVLEPWQDRPARAHTPHRR